MTDGKNASLADKVFEKLEDDILSGKYERGASLHESALAEFLGVSRTPLREAMRRLEQNGLLETIPNKGTFVRGISFGDIADIYDIRLRIEGLAIRKTVDRATEADIEELSEILDLQELYSGKNDHQKTMKTDSRFHDTIYRLCGSPELIAILCDLHNKIQRYRMMSFSSSGRAKTATEEHRRMFEAIAARDADLAEKLACEHIKSAKDNLIKLHKEQGLWD